MLRKQLLLKLFSVISIFLALIQSSPAEAKCINDYRVQQLKTYHNIPEKVLTRLEVLADQGKAQQGWKIVGDWGDPYAALAAKVLSSNNNPRDKFYRKLIASHWINTNGIEKYRKLFHPTAKKHFRQYVGLLRSGYWPDSDQIVLSYLTAVRSFNLPDITVFDAAWDAAGFNRFRTWQSLNQFSKDRTVLPTKVCMKIDSHVARQILGQDFADLPFEYIFRL